MTETNICKIKISGTKDERKMKFKEKINLFNAKHGLTIDSTADEKIPVAFDVFKDDFGYWKSMKEMAAVDKDGNPIPWFTYPAIEYLDQFDFSKMDIFEYGCGNSSLFWSQRANSVTSVEHNIKYIEIYTPQIKENMTIHHIVHKEKYEEKILSEDKKFDIIVIDGNFRRNYCTKHAIEKLKKNGMIIFDNSERVPEREDYAEATKFLRDNDLIQIDFFGFGPIKEYTWCTSIFITRDFKFPLKANHQPYKALGNL